jgi:hypothetical protein
MYLIIQQAVVYLDEVCAVDDESGSGDSAAQICSTFFSWHRPGVTPGRRLHPERSIQIMLLGGPLGWPESDIGYRLLSLSAYLGPGRTGSR